MDGMTIQTNGDWSFISVDETALGLCQMPIWIAFISLLINSTQKRKISLVINLFIHALPLNLFLIRINI